MNLLPQLNRVKLQLCTQVNQATLLRSDLRPMSIRVRGIRILFLFSSLRFDRNGLTGSERAGTGSEENKDGNKASNGTSLFVYLFLYLFICIFSHLFIDHEKFIYSFICRTWSANLFLYWFIYLSKISSLIYQFLDHEEFIYLFNYWLIYLFIYRPWGGYCDNGRALVKITDIYLRFWII